MAVYLPEDRREEFEALWWPRWKSWCFRWLAAGAVLFVLGTATENAGFGLLVGISTFLAGIWLSYYLVQGTVAREIRDRLGQ